MSRGIIPQLLDVVGNTPVVQLRNLTKPSESNIVVKLESVNPGGSLKDRAAWYIIRRAEIEGRLRPGDTIIESSSGNFGIALAMIGASRGYNVIALVDPKVTSTNRALLEAFGAEVMMVDQMDDAGSYHKTRIALANELSRKIPNSFRPDQCFNPLNSEAHFRTTAQELLASIGPQLHSVVCTVSTGGQLGGIARYFSRYAPQVRVVGVDVHGSTIFGGSSHSYLTPGVGLSWTPTNLDDLSAIHEVYKISDEDSFAACRSLVRNEGLLSGVSTGAALIVALRLAMNGDPDHYIAFLAADRGERYLHTAFNSDWLSEQGLNLDTSADGLRIRAGQLQPLSTRPAQECANYADDLAQRLGSPTKASTSKMGV